MQKDLEILKDEDGLIIKKLSDKKLLLVYKVPILLGYSDVVVGYLPVKIRYRINALPFDSITDKCYKCFGALGEPIKRVSKKWGIKMNKIDIQSQRKVINIKGNDYSFDRVFTGLFLIDPVWIREYQLKKVLL